MRQPAVSALGDGRDLMFYRLRRQDGSSDPFSKGSIAHPDGRVVVVSQGQAIDSASVVGIGPGGVELEDRGGRFTLRIP